MMSQKLTIAFYCSNSHLPDIDFASPEMGNPGCGAAEYLHVAIPYHLKKYFDDIFDIKIIADNTHNLPPLISNKRVNGVIEAAKYAASINADIFVFRPRIHEENGILDVIDQLKLRSVGRAALTPSWKHLLRMSESKYFKSLVCVGKSQYIDLMDSPISNKIIHINNGISDNLLLPRYLQNENVVPQNKKDIVFMGSLVPQKNFHYLAEVWNTISTQLPEAKLHVIGSAAHTA